MPSKGGFFIFVFMRHPTAKGTHHEGQKRWSGLSEQSKGVALSVPAHSRYSEDL